MWSSNWEGKALLLHFSTFRTPFSRTCLEKIQLRWKAAKCWRKQRQGSIRTLVLFLRPSFSWKLLLVLWRLTSDDESNGCQPIFFTVCDAVVLFFSQHQILQFSSNLKFCIRQGSLYSKMHFPNLAPFQVFPSFIVWCNLQGRVPSSWKNSPCVRKQRLVMLKQPKRCNKAPLFKSFGRVSQQGIRIS